MNSILERVAESLVEEDGGLECEACYAEGQWGMHPVAGGEGDTLFGECPSHGRFSVDVAGEVAELREERRLFARDDFLAEQYDLHRDMEREMR